MTKLNIGMIGAGFIGQLAHLMNFIEVKDSKVLGLAEYKPLLRSKVAARYDIPKTYASHHDLIADPEIDAVVVVTPRSLTGPVVIDCLKAGKHVLSEKPMAGNSERAQTLLHAAKLNNVRYAVGYMKRFDAGVEAAKNALTSAMQTGALGKILSVHATCFMGNSYCNPYGHVVTDEKPEYATGGGWEIAPKWLPEKFHPAFGAYLNTYSHITNLLRYLFDTNPNIEYVNMTSHGGQLAILNFEHFLATLETGKMSHNDWSEIITITFSDGEIRICMPPALLRNVPARVEIYYAGTTQRKELPCINWSWAFRRQAESFVADILQGAPMRNSAEEAYQDLVLIEDIWKAELTRIDLSKQIEQTAA